MSGRQDNAVSESPGGELANDVSVLSLDKSDEEKVNSELFEPAGNSDALDTGDVVNEESHLDDENNSDYDTPTGPDEEPLFDDLVDEEKLKEEEESLTEEQLLERFQSAKAFKNQGNDGFGHNDYRESVLVYTKGLLICPLREKEFRSILYSNRSASKVKLGMKLAAIQDCTHALENNPEYVRPLLRRAKLYEEVEKLDEALADYRQIIQLDPSVRDAHVAVQRLPEQINERNEKLKTEMLSKLKDLGNLVLRPFGLSTDNFQLQQDPNSGGYSVNFTK